MPKQSEREKLVELENQISEFLLRTGRYGVERHILSVDLAEFMLKDRERIVEALKVAINTVECDSYGLDSKGNKFELPWYRMAKKALSLAGVEEKG